MPQDFNTFHFVTLTRLDTANFSCAEQSKCRQNNGRSSHRSNYFILMIKIQPKHKSIPFMPFMFILSRVPVSVLLHTIKKKKISTSQLAFSENKYFNWKQKLTRRRTKDEKLPESIWNDLFLDGRLTKKRGKGAQMRGKTSIKISWRQLRSYPRVLESEKTTAMPKTQICRQRKFTWSNICGISERI